MTQSITFHFTSSQFIFESGTVVFTKGARLFADGDFQVGQIKDGSIDDVLVEGPIEFDAMLSDLTVVRSENGCRYHVDFLKVTSDLRPDDLRVGRVVVRLDPRIILVVRVEDSTGRPVPNATVSLHLPSGEATLDAQTDVHGQNGPSRRCRPLLGDDRLCPESPAPAARVGRCDSRADGLG